MDRHKPYLRKVAASSLFNSLSSAAATVVFLPFIIRHVGMDAYGLWAVLGVFVGITSALDLGIWKSVVYLMPRWRDRVDELVSSALWLCVITGSVFTLLVFGALAANAPIFGRAVAAQHGLSIWIGAAGCVVVFASLFSNVIRGVMEALFKGHWVNIGFALLTFLQYGLAAGIAYWSGDPRYLVAASALVYLTVFTIHFLYLRLTSDIHLRAPARPAMTAIMAYGIGAFLADLPSILLGPSVLYLFVLVSQKGGEYGVFDIAFKIATLAASTLSMLAAPFFAITASVQKDAQDSAIRAVSQYLWITILLGVAGCLTYWLAGDWLLAVFFPEQPHEIYRTSLVMLLGAAALSALEPISRMHMGFGHLGRLSAVRYIMLGGTFLSIIVLKAADPLSRFSHSVAIGFGLGALALGWSGRADFSAINSVRLGDAKSPS